MKNIIAFIILMSASTASAQFILTSSGHVDEIADTYNDGRVKTKGGRVLTTNSYSTEVSHYQGTKAGVNILTSSGHADKILQIFSDGRVKSVDGRVLTFDSFSVAVDRQNPQVQQQEAAKQNIDLTKSYSQASTDLISLYKDTLTAVREFREWSLKDDTQKFQSYVETLERAITSVIDEKGNPRLPVTHWMMIENARLVLGLSEIAVESIKPYMEHKKMAEQLTAHAQSIKTMGEQIRKAYGWSSGLVGGGSKAVSTLAMIIRTVLLDLEQLPEIKGTQPAQSVTRLRSIAEYLVLTGEAHEGGDAYAARSKSFEEFVSTWNSAEIQGVLGRLATSKGDLAPAKTKLLLMSVSGLKTLTGAAIEIPQQR